MRAGSELALRLYRQMIFFVTLQQVQCKGLPVHAQQQNTLSDHGIITRLQAYMDLQWNSESFVHREAFAIGGSATILDRSRREFRDQGGMEMGAPCPARA